MTHPSPLRITMIVNRLGYGDQLLYWRAILEQIHRVFPKLAVFTALDRDKHVTGDLYTRGLNSRTLKLGRRKESYDKTAPIIGPRLASTALRSKPDVIVLMEFSSATLSMICMKRLFARRAKTLLLVESDPRIGRPKPFGIVARAIRRLVSKRVDHVLTNNRAGHDYLVNELRVQANKITCAPYLVSTPNISPETRALRERALRSKASRLRFVAVGRLTDRKGYHEVIRALAEAPTAVRDAIALTIIGDGPEREELQRLIDAASLDETVRLSGAADYDQIAARISQEDVFLMPTLHDYRALAGFEALACGMPIMHSIYDGASRETVVDDRNGIRFDPRDPKSCLHAFEWFLSNRHRLPDMSASSVQLSSAYSLEASRKAFEHAVAATVGK